MTTDEQYMQRCLQLAELGAGYVAPNPMVGAVLMHGNRIIGEGYHEQYGQAHAEVNCLASVAEADKKWIAESTMYVTLEPCAHFGKTPPCADRLIAEKVKRVVIACRDPFAQVNGKGIEKLLAAGVEVTTCVLEKEAAFQNRRFFTFHTKKRPYIILKWAQSADGFIGKENERTPMSHASTQVLLHRWRSEEAAIMVGTKTALVDDPKLNNRLYSGPSPTRILIDRNLSVPSSANLLDNNQPTIIFNYSKNELQGNNRFVQIINGADEWLQIFAVLYEQCIQSVLVEGGAMLLQSLIQQGLWDEARIISNQQLQLGSGVAAPKLLQAELPETITIAFDTISTFINRHP